MHAFFSINNTHPQWHSNEFILFALPKDGTYLQKLISPNIDGGTKRTVQDLLEDFSTSTHQAGKRIDSTTAPTVAGSSLSIFGAFHLSSTFFLILCIQKKKKNGWEQKNVFTKKKQLQKKSDCIEWWNAVCCAPLMVCRYISWWLRETRQ